MAQNAPLAIIQNIDSEQGESIARTLLAQNVTNIRGLTTNTDRAGLSSLLEKWTTAEGVELVELVWVERGNKEALQRAFAGATLIVINTDYGHYLQEHSSLSLADVWKKPVEWIAEFREVAEAKDAVAAAAGVPGLGRMFLSMVPGVVSEEGDILEATQASAKAAIRDHVFARYPTLAAKTELLWSVTDAGEQDGDMEQVEEQEAGDEELEPGLRQEQHEGRDDEGMEQTNEVREQEDEEDESMPHQVMVEEDITVQGVGVPMIIFDTGIQASEDEVRRSGEEMLAMGYVHPTLANTGGANRSANGRDRNTWINYADL